MNLKLHPIIRAVVDRGIDLQELEQAHKELQSHYGQQSVPATDIVVLWAIQRLPTLISIMRARRLLPRTNKREPG